LTNESTSKKLRRVSIVVEIIVYGSKDAQSTILSDTYPKQMFGAILLSVSAFFEKYPKISSLCYPLK